MKFQVFLPCLVATSTVTSSFGDVCQTIADIVCDNGETERFCQSIFGARLNMLLSSGEFTLFVPTDKALENLEKSCAFMII
jgi:uncharacterized surface protein with fasciclin (FAS1) repeats